MFAIYKNTVLLLAIVTGLSSALEAEAATYDAALKDAMAKGDAKICDTIDKPLFRQDYGISVEQAQEMCRIEVVAAQGKPEGCMELDNKRHFNIDVTVRHRCLERMALSLKRPDICDMIPPEEESTDENLHHVRCKVMSVFSERTCREKDPQAQMRLFRDNCRLNAIADPKQCTQGFYVPETRRQMNNPDVCILTVAVNTRNAALCAMSTSIEKRGVCETNVRQLQDNDKAANDPGAGETLPPLPP
jgi:hypothetical protein